VVELRVLGPLELIASDRRPVESLIRRPRRAALLAYLAAAVPRGLHRRDKLLALFWPELDEPHARGALSQALYVLRQALGEDTIATCGNDSVGLAADAVWCDAVAFEARLDDGHPDDALTLYRGELLDGFFIPGAPTFEHWLERERGRLRDRAADGAWVLADRTAASGDALVAERWARRAAGMLPGDEAVARRLMAFLRQLGDGAAAIRAYEAFASELATQYSLGPSMETRALAEAIRAERRPLLASDSTGESPPLPS
jgi:serine/threonine-protein kinase